jgi:kynurenine 3-monooxygenase
MHPINSKDYNHTIYQAYGKGDEAIYSISRNNLNKLLLDELEKYPNVELIFNEKIKSIDNNANILTHSSKEYSSKYVIGSDGAYSSVRNSLAKLSRLDCSLQYIQHGYKELTIPPKTINNKLAYALKDWQGLHIWPRDEFMLIALPNPDYSFTCTLFAPFNGFIYLAAISLLFLSFYI